VDHGRTFCSTGPRSDPDHVNVAVELTDRIGERGMGDRVALIDEKRPRTYQELAEWSNRAACTLVEDYGDVEGARVLLRSGNNPAFIAAWLGVTKAGAVDVNSLPRLRAGDLAKMVVKAQIALALSGRAGCQGVGLRWSRPHQALSRAFEPRRVRAGLHVQPRRVSLRRATQTYTAIRRTIQQRLKGTGHAISGLINKHEPI